MMNALIKQLKKYGNLTSEIEKLLNEKIKILTKQKGDYLLKEGQTASILFVIESGLIRYFYTTPENEINVGFGFENEILGSVMPLFFNRPAIENIQFLEDTTLYYISSNDLDFFYRSSQEMNTIGRKIAEKYCKILEERSFLLQTHSATERYNWLLLNKPETLQRISLGHLASYLCISQETLSRIRKK